MDSALQHVQKTEELRDQVKERNTKESGTKIRQYQKQN